MDLIGVIDELRAEVSAQVAEKYGWGFANINLRSYYAEGAKTYGFEIAEQLGGKFHRHVVSPVDGATTARAGVALLAATRATATMAIHGKTFCMSSPWE